MVATIKTAAQAQTPQIDYEYDFYGWTLQQATLLRNGQFGQIDSVNIAEELEDLARSEKRQLSSRFEVLLTHLLKWYYQIARRSRSWELTIKEQRLRIEKVLRDNPSLTSVQAELLLDVYELAVLQAARETGLEPDAFTATCPWSVEQVLTKGLAS